MIDTGQLVEAAVWYGFVVHFRIYPIIYVIAILVILDNNYTSNSMLDEARNAMVKNIGKAVEVRKSKVSYFVKVFNRNRIIFGIISGGVFFLLTGICYCLYGDKFLHEALLYHLTRTDPRHNFSIYFYHIYLHHERQFTLLERLLAFVPQFLVQSVLTTFYARDIPFCFFVQTVAFVAFNKVRPLQYFQQSIYDFRIVCFPCS